MKIDNRSRARRKLIELVGGPRCGELHVAAGFPGRVFFSLTAEAIKEISRDPRRAVETKLCLQYRVKSDRSGRIVRSTRGVALYEFVGHS